VSQVRINGIRMSQVLRNDEGFGTALGPVAVNGRP
jgi:hypothetical protein